MMHATSMADSKPPSIEKLLGYDGTKYSEEYISPDEYDWDEHKDKKTQ